MVEVPYGSGPEVPRLQAPRRPAEEPASAIRAGRCAFYSRHAGPGLVYHGAFSAIVRSRRSTRGWRSCAA